MSTPIYDQLVEERFTAELADLTAAFPDPEDVPIFVEHRVDPPRRINVLVTATAVLFVVAALLGWWLS